MRVATPLAASGSEKHCDVKVDRAFDVNAQLASIYHIYDCDLRALLFDMNRLAEVIDADN